MDGFLDNPLAVQLWLQVCRSGKHLLWCSGHGSTQVQSSYHPPQMCRGWYPSQGIGRQLRPCVHSWTCVFNSANPRPGKFCKKQKWAANEQNKKESSLPLLDGQPCLLFVMEKGVRSWGNHKQAGCGGRRESILKHERGGCSEEMQCLTLLLTCKTNHTKMLDSNPVFTKHPLPPMPSHPSPPPPL